MALWDVEKHRVAIARAAVHRRAIPLLSHGLGGKATTTYGKWITIPVNNCNMLHLRIS